MKQSFKTGSLLFSALTALVIGHQATAQTAPRDLQGYQCMALNLTPQQMMDPSVHVSIYKSPSPNALVTGNAIATVIVSDPEQEQAGFLKVLQLNGRSGWVNSRYLKPWVNPGGNGQSCYPAILASGRIGFDYR